MRFGLQTWGSDGDIRPLLALAGGLRGAGHDVTLAATSVDRKDYAPLAAELGVRYLPVAPDVPLDLDAVRDGIMHARTVFHQTRAVFELAFEPCAHAMYEAAKSLCRDCDVLVGHHVMHPLRFAAQAAGRPYASVTLFHGMVRSAHAPPPGAPSLGRFGNRCWWSLVERLVDLTLRGQVNRFCRREGLPPVRRLLDEAWVSRELNLIAVSRVFCPPQPDWEHRYRVCGFLHLPPERSWEMPPDLREFLAAGPAPVYMGFGSLQPFDPEDVVPLFEEAASRARCRVLIRTAPGDARRGPQGDVYYLGYAPHSLVFPHCAAVVHHGGAGTSHSATRAGCPSIVVEYFGDQPLWGAELRRIGVAGPLLHRRTVTAARLARAVRLVLDSERIRAQATKLGGRMRQEDGVGSAVTCLTHEFGPGGGPPRTRGGPGTSP